MIPKLTKPRIPVREIPCDDCGNIFGQTAYEKRENSKTCPTCKKIARDARKAKMPPKEKGPRHYLEIVLPKKYSPFYDTKREEWCMRVKVRKRGTSEPFAMDRVYLGVKGRDANPDAVRTAFTAAFARMEMEGRSKKTAEQIKKKQKIIRGKKHDKRSWVQGKDKDMGITKVIIRSVAFRVYLPDPLVDGKKHNVGRFKLRREARKARDEKYRELRHQYVPCAVCGRLPLRKAGALVHITHECPNKVQIPNGVRALLQAKLWNLVFSSGERENVGVLTHEQLADMGYMYKAAAGFRYFAKTDVEFDFSLAKKYAKVQEPEEEIGFE